MKNLWIAVVAAAALAACATSGVSNADDRAKRGAEQDLPFAVQKSAEPAEAESMTNDAIDEILRAEVEALERQGPVWMFEYNGIVMVVVSDESSDRMRIVAPIVPVEELPDARLLFVLMEANFHTALDARYATSDGVVYSTFIHPLSSLTGEDFRSALDQVSNLVLTFGTTFSGARIEHADIWGYE